MFIRLFLILMLILMVGAENVTANDDRTHKTVSDPVVLRIAGWDVYADPHARNKTIGYESFEQQSGYQIEFTPLTNLDDIIHYAESHQNIDVLIISNEGIKILHKMNLVRDLELEQIPFYQELHHSLRYSQWSQFGGKIYAVPWAWGPTGLLYDSQSMPAPDSWNIFWDPRYKGRVTLWNDVSMIWTTALALGYKNVYNLTQEQLEAVRQKILQLNDQVHAYYDGEQEEMKLLASKKILLANSWFDPSARLVSQDRQFKMVIPKEGAVGMFDSYMISHNTNKSDIAHRFINHQLSPQVQKKMCDITGLAPANIETLALMSQDEIKALHLDDQNYFRKMLLWDVMPRKQLYDKVMADIRQDMKNRKKQKD